MRDKKIKRIPYGISNFEQMQTQNFYYVDKTRFIYTLEDASNYIFFLRPRRFGKTLLLSTLECYYDINKKNKFDELFKDTEIYKAPTELKNKYYILYLNFSSINSSRTLAEIEKDFDYKVYSSILNFYVYYKDVMGGKSEFDTYYDKKTNATSTLATFIDRLALTDIKVYLLIDEYDNFANNILMDKGEGDYIKVTHGEGFLKSFFATVKEGANRGVIEKFFATGVSPLVLNDMTSGMNIAENVSLDIGFNSIVGFNDDEVEEILEYYIQENGIKREDKETIKDIFKKYYNNFCFSKKYNERVHNSNMIFYFLREYTKEEGVPSILVEQNFATDYTKIQYMVFHDKQDTSNYKRFTKILEDGEVECELVRDFPINEIRNDEKFISLLYYLGLLTIKGNAKNLHTLFEIPNEAIRSLEYKYITDIIKESYLKRSPLLDELSSLYEALAVNGKWEELFNKITKSYYEVSSIRDTNRFEIGLKMFFLGMLRMNNYHIPESESELNRGYTDIYLRTSVPLRDVTKYEYLIEFKYIKEDEKADITKLEEKATKQLKQYEQAKRIDDAKETEKIIKKIILIASSKKLEVLKEVS